MPRRIHELLAEKVAKKETAISFEYFPPKTEKVRHTTRR